MGIIYKEIHDTFNALQKTADYLDKKWDEVVNFLKGKERFVFMGAGSSYSVAKSMATICSMTSGKPSYAVAAGDFLLHAERYGKIFNNAAIVFATRSGRTSELLMALDEMKSKNLNIAGIVSLVCADGTPIEEKSSLTLSTPWAFDESVCQTRTVTNFYFMAAYVAAKLSDAGEQPPVNELRNMLLAGPEYIKKIEPLAKDLSEMDWTHAVVLADAEMEGIAEEGSLVFKEVCQLPSNYYHMLDVRHGPMVLLGKDSLVLTALGDANELERSLLRDLRKKGATIAAFSDIEIDLDDIISVSYGSPLSHISKGIPFIILCQLIAYYKSMKTGADPDKPTGLEPWIALGN